MQRTFTIAALAAALAFAAPAGPASAVDFGVRAGVYDDAGEAFVGGELLAQLSPRWFFNPNVEYVFVDDGDLITVNGDFHYDFPVDFNGYVWAGGGPALILDDREFPPRGREDDDDTDLGVNLLGGVGWRADGLVPYVQGKIILADETEAVLAFGLRF
jgi:hypothetical protein